MKIWKKSEKHWHTPLKGSDRPLRRLLVCRPDRLGDMVITTSCLEPLRRCLPDVHLTFAVRDAFLPLLRGNPHVDELLGIPAGAQVQELCASWEGKTWDAVAHLNPDPVMEEVTQQMGVPIRVGYSRGKGERLTAWISYAWKKKGLQHEAMFNFDVLDYFGVKPPSGFQPNIHVAEAPSLDTFLEQGSGPLVLFHLASHGRKPRVPAAFFAGLARRILMETHCKIIVVGQNSEDVSLQPFFGMLGGENERLINLAGKTSIAELAHLCSRAALMVSRDSGPAHLAAAVGCPTLTFFINCKPLMSPTRWKPLGGRVEIYQKRVWSWPWEPPRCLAWRIVRHFREDEVMDVVNRLLGDSLEPQNSSEASPRLGSLR